MIVIESGFTGTAYGLKNPRIAAFPLTGTVAASTETTGYEATLAANAWPYQAWRPTAVSATWELDFGGTQWVSYCGIAGHDMASKGNTVAFQRWTGSAWVTVASNTPTDNQPILFLATRRQMTKARIEITGGTAPSVGVIRFGDVTEFPQRSAYVGRQDFQQKIAAEYRSTISDGGAILGRYIARRSQTIALQVDHLSETWKAATLDPLITHLETEAVFVADRPSVFPQSLVYGLTTGPVVPERTMPNSAVSVSVAMEFTGHVA